MDLHTTARTLAGRLGALAASCAAVLVLALAPAGAADPIKIGLSLSLTGATAPAGRQVQTGLEIWRDHVNAKGGLLGRPVELVYYDDQANPANAPGIYAKLMGVDKVDLLDRPLQHQRDRGGAARDHPEPAHDDRDFRARRQQGVQVHQIFFDEFAGRLAEELFARILPARPATAAEARTRRPRRRRRRVLAQRARRRARERQGVRLRRGLRAHLSARQHRIRDHRALDAGGHPGRRLCRDAAGRHRGASCAHRTRCGSSRSSTAAPFSVCW